MDRLELALGGLGVIDGDSVDDDGVVLLDVDEARGADELHFWQRDIYNLRIIVNCLQKDIKIIHFW